MTTAPAPVVVSAQNGRIFRLGRAALDCAHDLLSGGTPEEVAAARAMDLGAVRGIAASLASAGVTELTEISEAPRAKRLQAKGFTAIQFTIWYPGARFRAMASWWSIITGRTASLLVATFAVIGIGYGLATIDVAGLPSKVGLGEGLLVVLCTLFLTSVHELGHVLALGAHGRSARRVGLMLFYGSFAMFSDVTPAWELPEKAQRLRVIWWGLLVTAAEAAGAGLLAGVVHSQLLTLIFLGLLATLAVNLVPLARFDGYYLLILALGRPRLRDTSIALAKDVVAGRSKASDLCRGQRQDLLFGVASVGYGCLLWAYCVVQSIVTVQVTDGVGFRLVGPPLLPLLGTALTLFACYVLIVRLAAPQETR